ncbi:MAG: hypothetical protein WBA65_10070 [Rhodanobacter sp.]|jgi:hypothetical protein
MAVAKKAAMKKPVTKKAAAKRAVVKKAAATRLKPIPAGYVLKAGTKLMVPSTSVVEPSKIRKGLAKAKDEIDGLIQEIVDISTTEYEIAEIEFAASFSADGKFMGVGVGGSATVTFRIRPCK